jgi:hypothetical protein
MSEEEITQLFITHYHSIICQNFLSHVTFQPLMPTNISHIPTILLELSNQGAWDVWDMAHNYFRNFSQNLNGSDKQGKSVIY